MDNEGACGGCCAIRFRSQVLLVSTLYLVFFAISLAAIASASVSDDAIGFAILVGVISPSIHFLFSLIGMLSPVGARKVAELDSHALVVVSDWVLAAALGLAATSISLQGVFNKPEQRPYAILANALIATGQLGCAAKTAEWTDSGKFDPQDGTRLDAGGF